VNDINLESKNTVREMPQSRRDADHVKMLVSMITYQLNGTWYFKPLSHVVFLFDENIIPLALVPSVELSVYKTSVYEIILLSKAMLGFFAMPQTPDLLLIFFIGEAVDFQC
jgi:hypothetical protein